jgi:RNA polymerase sigma factor (sigma-70 family)
MENRIKNYRVRIYHFIQKFVKDSALAEDLTQDIMLKIWVNREKIFRLEDIDAYVMVMSRNHVMDHFKRLAKEKSYQEEVWRLMQNNEDRVESNLAVKDIEARLDAILKVLPKRQQQIFELNHKKGLTLKEISSMSNTEVNGPAITVIWGQLFRESLVQNV